jgi:hypothetical protein
MPRLRRPSGALVVAFLALFVALSGVETSNGQDIQFFLQVGFT